MKKLVIRGARQHNLKSIDLELPRESFVVISGMSGSGKSSLAFDTIYAEGRRRYVESLSAYARQFLGRIDKPDLDYIEGLSPAISIEQKTTGRNPRSTVGTATEIYDYYRLLFARIGTPHDPETGEVLTKQTTDEIIDALESYPEGARLTVLAPVVRGRRGRHERVLEDARRAGFVRVRVDGEVRSLDEAIELDKNARHSIDVVVDRLKAGGGRRTRIAEAVEAAAEAAGGRVVVHVHQEDAEWEDTFSQHFGSSRSGTAFPELEPPLFSFNSPYGACPVCSGLGITLEFDPELVVPDPSRSFEDGGFVPYNPNAAWYRRRFEGLAEQYGFSLETPLVELPEETQRSIMEEVLSDLGRRYRETSSDGVREWLEEFMSRRPCERCGGRRLRPEALAVTVGGKNIHEVTALSVSAEIAFLRSLELSETEAQIAGEVKKEILSRLSFMENVGLDYLSLDRAAATLSGGEAQRIRLATQIGASLVGVLYILDEPTIGLHPRDNERLLHTLMHLRDIGNTLIVVEHDEQTLRSADYIVDLGPGAGVHGGEIVAEGPPESILAAERSLTGAYLCGRRSVPMPGRRREGSGASLVLRGAAEHNLRSIDVSFPLGTFTVITGVSGSGKSTLLADVLYPAVREALSGGARHLGRQSGVFGAHARLEGTEHLDKVINIDQSPIGRTPRSNPATYVGLFTPIRELFASLPQSRARGYKPGRFSFNVPGGRCENCAGAGTIRIEMHFLPDVYVTCDVCGGRRFNRETLDVHYRGKNIHEVLELTVTEALEFFSAVPQIRRRLETLKAVGLEYLKLGQSGVTLSGGEAQRVKLSQELSRRSTGRTLYILDEPTTGLHFEDVRKLLEVLHTLVDRGNTVIVIEHNLDVVLQADHLVDLGPEGGEQGGRVVASGTPEHVATVADSHTGRFIRQRMS
ncbi:MAG: excinuclease ABC subunit UvrA [Spirochaetaceae bacterium]